MMVLAPSTQAAPAAQEALCGPQNTPGHRFTVDELQSHASEAGHDAGALTADDPGTARKRTKRDCQMEK